jgi:hypothetical protein
MIHLKRFETFNIQDMMTIPTSITKGNQYTKDSSNNFIQLLQPYYNYIKSLTIITDLTQITFEKLDNYVGFSFIMYYNKIMILSDKKQVHILINNSLILLKDPNEMSKIIESEI